MSNIEENNRLNHKKVAEIIKKEGMASKLKLHEKIWYKNMKGVKKGNLAYDMTNDELSEYLKSSLSIHYFAEKYCQIKREDGSIGPMTLRDYQKDIIDLYTKNQFSILMASRQVGKCNSFNIKVLRSIEGKDEYISIGELYYQELKKLRPLKFTEKIKYFLYKIYQLLS